MRRFPGEQERLSRSDAAWRAVFCGVQLFKGVFIKGNPKGQEAKKASHFFRGGARKSL